ncbi:MAG TPA: cation transporting ATPase C-terminal domain-containing protein, partial [Pseudomonadales bacterium]|nr:cation transporting ATPase C-terminal domain-containing protein [Pseudomonadales bacterium]
GRPHGVKPEDLLKEGPEASLGEALTRDIEWRAVFTTAVTSVSWALARGTPQASTVALMSLISSQLGQAIIAGHGSRTVLGSSVAALVLMGVIVQTPGLSRFFGCQPLDARSWINVLGSMGITIGGSLVMPSVARVLGDISSAISQRLKDELAEEIL